MRSSRFRISPSDCAVVPEGDRARGRAHRHAWDGRVHRRRPVENAGYSGISQSLRRLPAKWSSHSITVNTARLDDMLPTDYEPKFIKIDVEGAELGVLRGARDVLGRYRPILFIEHGAGRDTGEILDPPTGLGYAIHNVDGDGPFDDLDAMVAGSKGPKGSLWNWGCVSTLRWTAMRLILVRHGEAYAGFDGLVAGPAGCNGLTPGGRRQAEALRYDLAGSGRVRADTLLVSLLPGRDRDGRDHRSRLGVEIAAPRCDLCEVHPGEATDSNGPNTPSATARSTWKRNRTVLSAPRGRELEQLSRTCAADARRHHP